MMRQMYFGTKKRMRWVKMFAPRPGYSMVGSSERMDFSNGGAGLRNSVNGHMEYQLTWNTMTGEEARQVTDYAYGLYGSDSIYFVDPAAAHQNVLNKAWSAPGLTAKDGVPLAGRKRPRLVQNLDLSRDCPADMARYDLTATDERRSFYVPIPPGYVAWVSVRGDSDSTLGLTVQPTVGDVNAGAPTLLPVEPTSSTGAPTSFAGSGGQSGISLSIEGSKEGFITLGALMVQILHEGETANHARWISGQGASGCEFEGRVHPVPSALHFDRYSLSVKLVETEDWL